MLAGGDIFLHTFRGKVWPRGSATLSFGENIFSTTVAALCNTSADQLMGRGLRKMDRGGGGHTHTHVLLAHKNDALVHTHSADQLMGRGLCKMDRGGGGHTRAKSTKHQLLLHPPPVPRWGNRWGVGIVKLHFVHCLLPYRGMHRTSRIPARKFHCSAFA